MTSPSDKTEDITERAAIVERAFQDHETEMDQRPRGCASTTEHALLDTIKDLRGERDRIHEDYNREYVKDTEALWGQINDLRSRLAAAEAEHYKSISERDGAAIIDLRSRLAAAEAERDDFRDLAIEMVNQFAYEDDDEHIHTGGLSDEDYNREYVLAAAFKLLGLPDPAPRSALANLYDKWHPRVSGDTM